MSAPDEFDVAVIGGGAAGIAAARAVQAAGRSVLLIEADDRLGGRAHTAPVAGLPLDMGCGWLHSAERNPLVAIAERAGFAVDRSESAWREQWRELGFSRAQQQAAQRAFDAFGERLHAAPPASDRAGDALEAGCVWNGWLDAISGYVNGAGLSALSIADYLAYDDAASEVNWRLPAGYGALVAQLGEAVPARLGTRVTNIADDGALLDVTTSAGVLRARAAIISASTTILALGDIRLPARLDDRLHAASQLPLGLADKLFLAIDEPDAFEPETHLIGSPWRANTGSYYIRPFGRPIIECFFGGNCAQVLEHGGEGAAAAFAIDELTALLGGRLAQRLRPIAASAWGRHPSIGGSYSHALPGAAHARATLAAPDPDGRIAFAGEACSAHDFSTAHGAWASGEAAVASILARLGGALA